MKPAEPGNPVEPSPTAWCFPDDPEQQALAAAGGEVVGMGADLEPGTLLAAYRAGLFPMPAGRGQIGWWSPEPRGIIPPEGLRVSRSLRRSTRRFEVKVDARFTDVIAACSDPRRKGSWIDKRVLNAYTELHRLGWAHSVETYSGGVLAGGLYGVSIGGLFAGESMFHRVPDASKVALVALVEVLCERRATLLDVQWATPHLVSLGAVAVSRHRYHRLLRAALALPQGFGVPASRFASSG